jgi:hypothetical protein
MLVVNNCPLQCFSSVRKAGGYYHACVYQSVLKIPATNPSEKRAD